MCWDYGAGVLGAILVACSVLACAGRAAVNAAETVLVENGEARSVIVVPAQAAAAIREAAEDMVYHLKKMSGATVPVVNYPAAVTQVAVYIGVVPENVTLPVDLGDESLFWPSGYLILADGDRLILAAPSVRGVSNAVYGLLETHLGCHWFTIGEIGEHIPRRSTVKLSIEGGYEVVKPFFEIRAPWYSFGSEHTMTIGSALYDPLVPEFADMATMRKTRHLFNRRNRTEFRGYHGHYWSHIYTKDILDKHPGLRPFYGGRRQSTGQVCMSSPEAVAVGAEFFIRHFRDNPKDDHFSFSANDGGGWCECGECKAMASNNAGRVVLLGNEILDRVNAVHPNRRITFLIYYSTFDPPPEDIKVHRNLIGVVCPAGFSDAPWWMEQIKPLTSDHPDAVRYRQSMETWINEKGLRSAWMYDYVGWFPGPYTMFHSLQEEYDYHTKLGFRGEVSSYGGRNMGTDVHFWLRLSLSRDRNLTVEKLLAWFYPDYFGAAADEMRHVYEKIETHMRTVDPAVIPPPFHAIDLSRTPGLYPVDLLDECLASVALAREKVKIDRLRLARVRRDENCLRLIRLFVESYLASRAYYRTGNAADRDRAIEYANEYLERAHRTHFTPSLGAVSVLDGFTIDKAGPFAKRARLNTMGTGSRWIRRRS